MALLYTPKDVYPFQTTITAGQAVNFKVTINGAQCVAYRLYVKKVSDNSVVFDSGKKSYPDATYFPNTLYDGDILSVPVTLGADNYYWHIWMYWDSTNYINSQYYSFIASSSPSIVFFPSVPATITTPSYTFVGQYAQAENVLVKYFNISLYNENNILLDTSGNVYSQNIRYQFGGLLDGSKYRVRITGVTQGNVSFDTGYSDFVVSYTVPISLTSPTATVDDYSGVTVNWGNIKSIIGVVTGSSSYSSNWIYTGNVALHLTAGSYVTYTFDYGAPLTVSLNWSPDSIAFTGDIFEIRNTAGTDIIKFGYASGQFYLDNNGVKDNTNHTLTTNKYLLAIIFDGAYFTKYFREV